MISIEIPGQDGFKIKNAVFDFNGTLAADGKLPENILKLITKLKKDVSVYILTSDTYGTVRMECEGLGIQIKTITNGNEKRKFVHDLGVSNTVCIGNGMNDVKMFEESALSIAIIGEEGCAAKAFTVADIIVKSIEDAFALLLKPSRITATLRL